MQWVGNCTSDIQLFPLFLINFTVIQTNVIAKIQFTYSTWQVIICNCKASMQDFKGLVMAQEHTVLPSNANIFHSVHALEIPKAMF